MYDCLPLYHSTGGVVRDRRGAGQRRLGGDPRKLLGARVLGRHRALGLHAVPVYRRAVPLSGQLAAASERDASIGSGSPAATACAPTCGRSSRSGFGIPHILEFYARDRRQRHRCSISTASPAPSAASPGSSRIAFPPSWCATTSTREQPLRDAQGRCIDCEPDELGEVIGKIINDASKPGSRFEGYADQSETERKILRDVFEPGDAWFRTGDLMRKDEDGYFYLRRPHRRHLPLERRERLDHRGRGGDRPRSPVSLEANVYGVDIPGRDGRAGMAAIVGRRRSRPHGIARPSDRAAARLCPAGVPAHAQARSTSPRPSSRRRSIW